LQAKSIPGEKSLPPYDDNPEIYEEDIADAAAAKKALVESRKPQVEAFRKAIIDKIDEVEGAAEGTEKWNKYFLTSAQLDETRKRYSPRPFTTCVDFLFVLSAAAIKAKVQLKGAVNLNLLNNPDPDTPNGLARGAWHLSRPNMPFAERPRPGDVYMLASPRKDNPKLYDFSHVGFIRQHPIEFIDLDDPYETQPTVPEDVSDEDLYPEPHIAEDEVNEGDKLERWSTTDAGQGTATRFMYVKVEQTFGPPALGEEQPAQDVTPTFKWIITSEDKKTEIAHGTEKCVRNSRKYNRRTNMMTGEANQQYGRERWLYGWIDSALLFE